MKLSGYRCISYPSRHDSNNHLHVEPNPKPPLLLSDQVPTAGKTDHQAERPVMASSSFASPYEAQEGIRWCYGIFFFFSAKRLDALAGKLHTVILVRWKGKNPDDVHRCHGRKINGSCHQFADRSRKAGGKRLISSVSRAKKVSDNRKLVYLVNVQLFGSYAGRRRPLLTEQDSHCREKALNVWPCVSVQDVSSHGSAEMV